MAFEGGGRCEEDIKNATEMLGCPSGRFNSLKIGSLSNDDGHGIDNGKNELAIGLD